MPRAILEETFDLSLRLNNGSQVLEVCNCSKLLSFNINISLDATGSVCQ